MLCRGQFYWFDALDDNGDLVMTEKDLALNLQGIVDDAENTSIQEAAKGALGVLSTENRKTWAGLRDVLTRDENSSNAECLSIVDSALFILCLDYTEPKTGAEICKNVLCGTNEVVKGIQIGTCTNRWYDKLQIIVCKNGSAGINFEHTGVDGHTVLRFASDVYTDTILRYAKSINGQAHTLWTTDSPDPAKRDLDSFGDVSTTPHKLEWDMLPELSTALRFAETRLADLIQQNEFQTLEFTGYGSSFMKNMGFSPDAFVQMAFQGAYYGLYGRIENVYEPAMTKIFLHGRTEAIRAVTQESVEFVKTFWGDFPAQKKVDALKRAAVKHTAVTKECAKAMGQDRHLYALYTVWQRGVDEDGEEKVVYEDDDEQGEMSPISDNGPLSPQILPTNPALASSPSKDPPGNTTSRSRSRSSTHAAPAQLHNPPSIFTDSGWSLLNNTILSTSNCGNPSLRHFGFGPTSPEGFGIGYIIKEDSISVCASSKHRQTKRFIDSIEAYLIEMRKLLRATVGKSISQKGGVSRVRERDENERGDAQTRKAAPRSGRAIKSEAYTTKADDNLDQAAAEGAPDEEDEMGGYGFFDAGMLLQALKAREDKDLSTSRSSAASGRNLRRAAVGKKVRVGEY